MTHEEALRKAAKLLRLATSDNPHEAALAQSRAQEIMDRFKLTGGDINLNESTSSEPVQHFGHDPLDAEGSARWKGQLGVVIARQNQCKLYASNGTLCLIGRASDVQTVRYLYSWMVREIERLAARDCKGCGRTYWNNFRLGAVETVTRKLRESARETVAAVKHEAQIAGSSAIVLVEKSLAVIAEQEREVDLVCMRRAGTANPLDNAKTRNERQLPCLPMIATAFLPSKSPESTAYNSPAIASL